MNKDILIAGAGNTLRHDDGIGPAIIQLLKTGDAAKKADLVDAGTDALALIDSIKQYKKVLIIDAVNMGLPPGTVKTFSPDEAIINAKSDSLSTHGFGLPDLLSLLKQLDINPEIKIIGIQPKDISFGEGLSDEVSAKMDEIVKAVIEYVEQ